MGYIFDAMNHANDRAASHRPPEPTYGGLEDLPPADLANPADPAAFKFTAISGQFTQTPIDLDAVDDRLVTLTDPAGLMAEEYRAIRTGLLARWEQRRHLTHTITSATPQEGKTLTSLNLGMSLAELHARRTIVVECDLRLPQFENLLKLTPSAGLVGVLTDDADLNRNIQIVGDTGLHVLAAGRPITHDAVQLLGSRKMAALIRFLRREYDHVIIDTPPVVELADAGIVGAISDEVLLVTRMNRTPRSLVEQAVRTLNGYNAPVAGLIATDQVQHRHRYYYLRYGYRYHQRYRYHATKAA
jgi:capsular exopolysaccharide synthesis family protein